MRLYYTARSHFSRKVRILMDAWQQPLRLIDIGNVANTQADSFAANPLMRVPTLIDEGTWVIDSDHMAQYLCRQFDPQDRYQVLTEEIQDLNARAIINGAMAAEVELILAARTGIETSKYVRFEKHQKVILAALQWLEDNPQLFEGQTNYLGFHLVCLWDHLALYQLVELNYPRLQNTVERLRRLDFISASAPE